MMMLTTLCILTSTFHGPYGASPAVLTWWDSVVAGLYGDGWWKENLHTSRHTFTIICIVFRGGTEGGAGGAGGAIAPPLFRKKDKAPPHF